METTSERTITQQNKMPKISPITRTAVRKLYVEPVLLNLVDVVLGHP